MKHCFFFLEGRKGDWEKRMQVCNLCVCVCVCGCLFETTTRKQTVHRISFPRCQWAWQEKGHGKWCRTWVKEENETHFPVCRQQRICIEREIERVCSINSSIVSHWAFRRVNNRREVSHRVYDRSFARTFSNHYRRDAHRAAWEECRRTSPVHCSMPAGSMEMFWPNSRTTTNHCDRWYIHQGHWWLSPALLRLNSIQWHLGHLNAKQRCFVEVDRALWHVPGSKRTRYFRAKYSGY